MYVNYILSCLRLLLPFYNFPFLCCHYPCIFCFNTDLYFNMFHLYLYFSMFHLSLFQYVTSISLFQYISSVSLFHHMSLYLYICMFHLHPYFTTFHLYLYFRIFHVHVYVTMQFIICSFHKKEYGNYILKTRGCYMYVPHQRV